MRLSAFCLTWALLMLLILYGSYGLKTRTDAFLSQNKQETGKISSLVIENYNSDKLLCELTFFSVPKRVIAINQDSVETLLALGAGDSILAAVGVERERLLPQLQAAYDQIPFYSRHSLDLETALVLEPDFLLGWYSSFSHRGNWTMGTTEFWRQRQVNCYMEPASFSNSYQFQTLEHEYDYIRDMGRIFAKQEPAERIVCRMQEKVQAVEKRAEEDTIKPDSLILEFEGKELRAYGHDTLGGNIIEHLGVSLAYSGNHLSYEELLMIDPSVIFLVNLEETIEGGEQVVQRMYTSPAFQHLRAVQANRVYAVPLYAIYSSGIRSYDGICIFARGLYPELFANDEDGV